LKDSVNFWRNSLIFQKYLQIAQAQFKIQSCLVSSVDTRWGTVYLMLESVLENKACILQANREYEINFFIKNCDINISN
jgi:hypothetical protein